jgi:hypothetical protein
MKNKNAIQFIKDFGIDNDWKDMTYGDFVKSDIPNLIIYNLEEAIRVVRESKIQNVQLRQDCKVNGGTLEWDNF